MSGLSTVTRNGLGAVAFLLLAASCPASGSYAADPSRPRGTLEALKQESETSSGDLERSRAAARDDGARKEALGRYWSESRSLARRAFELAEDHPDDDEAVDAVIWVVQGLTSGFQTEMSAEIDKAYTLLAGRWVTSEKLAPVCCYGHLNSLVSPEAKRFLQEALEKSPHRLVRGVACLSLARHSNSLARMSRRMRDPITRKLLEGRYPGEPGFLKALETIDSETLDREAETLLERVIAQYADVRMPDPYNPTPLGEQARGELFRIRNLTVGRVAPEIEGEDLEGRKLTLGEHRGKVVALVFWATWCGPCMGMVPHERELVKRLEGKPFVLLGVNGDDGREDARKATAKERMSWRSWWNGGKTGSIVTQWGVMSWPAVYLLDPKGVIRYENVRFESLDQAVDRLVEEAEAEQKRERAF
jgi:thiol-disulfide isomerase/thioredoxin